MRITCRHCKEEIDVAMYFCNHIITKESSFCDRYIEYEAAVTGKTICPCCGTEINERFSSTIYNDDIVRLAIGKEN